MLRILIILLFIGFVLMMLGVVLDWRAEQKARQKESLRVSAKPESPSPFPAAESDREGARKA